MINVQFNDKAKQVLADTLDLNGSIVVNELPQIGEEHTIYELQEISKASYGWMFTLPFIDTSEGINLVFDTYEQMTTTMNEVKVVEGNTYPKRFLAYIRNTNQMYMLSPVFTNHPHWEFRELPKQDDESGTDYAFEVKYTEDKGSVVVNYQYTYYILKEFVANERPIANGGFEYSGITLDDKEVYVVGAQGKLFGVLNNITYPRFTMLITNFYGYTGAFTYDKLPNSVELETKCYNLLRLFGYADFSLYFTVYNTTDNAYYMLNPKTTSYQWYNNLEDRENCYFAQSGDYEGEPPHYTGELEWVYMESFDDYESDPHLKSLAFNEIPYNDMINHNPPFDSSDNRGCAFQPKKGGEITSTYWIYKNNAWVNIEDIGTIVLPVVSYGNSGKDSGLELSDFEFTVNGNKVDCVQYKINTLERGTSYGGYVTGISLPTENNTYSVSVRFIGDSSQIGKSDALILKAYDNTESNMLVGPDISRGTVNLEMTDINTLSIVFMGSIA